MQGNHEAQIHFILNGLELVLWPSALGPRQLPHRRGPCGLGSRLSARLPVPALQLHEETVPDLPAGGAGLGAGKLNLPWLGFIGDITGI